MTVETRIDLLETLLEPYKSLIGPDFEGYRNHVTRMLNFCFALHDCSEEERIKLITAGAFHDIGIWTEGTVDYLDPSVAEAMKYLEANGMEEWKEEIGQIIDLHHKVRAYQGQDYPLVEVFRKGDLVDFSLGAVRHGLPKSFVDDVRQAIPNAGFHKRLMQLATRQLLKKPWDPMPMMKW